MDRVSQRVVGTIGIVFGLFFLVVGIVRLTRPDPDVLLLVLNMLIGVLWLGTGVVLWRRALRTRDQADPDRRED